MKRFGVAVAVCGLVCVGWSAAWGQRNNPTSDGKPSDIGHPMAKRAMTFADLMALKRVSDPQISPSGKWVMFSVTDVSLEKNTKVNHLWVVPLGTATSNPTSDEKPSDMGHPILAERQITFGDGESFGRFSPDGKWVSISMKDQIYLALWNEAKGTVGRVMQLTQVSGGGADGAVWSPDSKRLMFTADVWPECSAATEMQTAWREEDACDQSKDDAAAAGSKGQVWDALLYRHWDHFVGGKRSHVLVVSATDGNDVRDLTPASVVGTVEVPTFFVGGAQDYAWAPDSKEIAYVAKLDKVPAASTNNDIYTLRLDEPGAKAVKVSTSPGSDDEPEYSPDGKWLAFRSQARDGFESDKFRLMVMDREKKTIKDLMPKFDGWVDEFVWQPYSRHILFVSGEQGAENLFGVGVEDGDFFRLTLGDGSQAPGGYRVMGHLVPDKDGELSGVQISPDGEIAVAVRMKVSRPAELVFVGLGPTTGPPHSPIYKVLTSVNDPILDRIQLSDLEPFWFEGAEGTKVEGFIMRPPGFDPAKKYPVKFLMHGGPQTAWGDAWSYRWNWELMAANGYVVVGINRRGSTGYGQKFVDEVSGDWGGRAYQDLMKGLDYAEAKFPFIDKTRECALGASYGGFMADWVLTHTNRFKCIVTHDGMYDPVSAYGATEELWFNEWEFRRPEDFPKGWDGFSGPAKANTEILTKGQNDGRGGVGHPAEPWRYQNLAADQDPFRKWSPMRFIENAKTPTLVIHSQRDMRLDVSQGFELFTALQRLGVPSKMLYFPDEGHWVLKPQNSQLWNEVVGDWCDKWTKTGKYAEK